MERAKHSRSLYGCLMYKQTVVFYREWGYGFGDGDLGHDPLDCAPAQEVEEVEELPSGTAL